MSRSLPLYPEGPADPALTRRDFVSRSVLAAVAASLAAACGGSIDFTAPGAASTTGGAGLPAAGLSVLVADFAALANVGGIARVDGGVGLPVAVTRIDAATFAAFSMVCPHQGTTIGISGSGFVCPNHGARFSAAGTWTGGQSTSNLQSLPVTYDAAAGTLTIAGAGAGSGGAGGGGGTGGGDDGPGDD
jgi:Rieske Fe-S protein